MKNKHISLPLHTLNGSVIARYKDNVGKSIGGKLYVHRRYMRSVVPLDLLEWILNRLPYGTKYNTIMWDTDSDSIRFDEALNFNTAREPWAGKFVTVDTKGNLNFGATQSIWHHKWLWVKDSYNGFNVKKSYEWSKTWLGKMEKPASGVRSIWRRQLEQAGL